MLYEKRVRVSCDHGEIPREELEPKLYVEALLIRLTEDYKFVLKSANAFEIKSETNSHYTSFMKFNKQSFCIVVQTDANAAGYRCSNICK